MDRFLGEDLWSRMTSSFGYLTMAGYGGHQFPVIIGETGTKLETVGHVCLSFIHTLVLGLGV